jgi:1-deoxy-D-xylulose-5-phosphate synthase
VEENVSAGGLGQQIRALCNHSAKTRVVNMSLPDTYIPHGKRIELLKEAGLSAPQIADTLKELLK